MADSDKATVAKVRKLLEVQKDLVDKLGAVTTEIFDLLAGGAGTAATLKDLATAFDELWCIRYAHGQTGRYVWTHVKDMPQMKRLIRTLGADELKARFARYIQNGDDFFTSRRHPFGLFVATVNQHAAPGSAATADDLTLEAPVGDCKHTPPCQSDQEHTKRRRAERKA